MLLTLQDRKAPIFGNFWVLFTLATLKSGSKKFSKAPELVTLNITENVVFIVVMVIVHAISDWSKQNVNTGGP